MKGPRSPSTTCSLLASPCRSGDTWWWSPAGGRSVPTASDHSADPHRDYENVKTRLATKVPVSRPGPALTIQNR